MGATEFEQGSGTNTQSQTETIGPGILTHLSVFTETPGVDPTDTWVVLSINRGGTAISNRTYLLTQGFITQQLPLTWDGLLEILSSDILYITRVGDQTTALRIVTQILNPKADGPLINYLRYAISPV